MKGPRYQRGFILNPYAFASGGGPAPGSPSLLYRVGITVPDASIASTLANFPVYVDLSGMPSSFWDHLARDDGGDIRVLDGNGNPLPFDLFWIDRAGEQGALIYKQTLTNGGATTAYIHYGNGNLNLLPVNDTYGRNAVWSDYERVFLYGMSCEDRTGNSARAAQVIVNNGLFSFENTSTSGDLGVHQGIAWDGTHYYAFDTNTIKKFDAAFSLVATNANPVGDVGNGTNHVGDGCVVDGIIYVPVETYVDINTFSNQRLARFNASDLSFIDSVSVSAQAHEVASCCFCPRDGYLYVGSYNDGSKLWRYNLSTLAYVSALSLSATITRIQGVTFWRGAFWVNANATPDATYRIEFNGTIDSRVYWQSGGVWEGLDHNDGGLLALHDTSGGATGVVRVLKPLMDVMGGGVDIGDGSWLTSDDVSRFTSWTLGATVRMATVGANRPIITYDREGGSDSTDRASLVYRQATTQLGLWNTTDSWLNASGTQGTGTTYRVHGTHSTTTDRKLYVNGGNVQVDSGVAQKPSGSGDCSLYMGVNNLANTEWQDGRLGFFYLRSGELSADWIAAEYANVTTPATFYSVGSEESQA